MKKVLLVLFLLAGTITMGVAQNLQEVVYLKNGSIVRGVVIEQIPGVSLKIQTSDGSVFAYQMSEVIKITKETTNYRNGNSLRLNNNSGNKTGYMGFIDFGYTFGIGDWGVDRLELSTSHGYQFTPYLYVGAGVAANYYTDAETFGLPIFAHIRGNILDNRISPYIDFRIGYSPLEEAQGFYMAPSVGCKIYSFNINFGYVMQKVRYISGATITVIGNGETIYNYLKDSANCGGLSLKIGFEF